MILNDSMFVTNGGQTGTSTPAQRQIAYAIAEEQVVDYLGYPLTMDVYTGVFPSSYLGDPIALPHTRVSRVVSTEVIYLTGAFHHYSWWETIDHVFLIDNERGIIDTKLLGHLRDLPGVFLSVVYEAGIVSGSFGLVGEMALAAAAQIILNELVVPGLTEARVGVQEFTNMKYSEKRFPLNKSIFGSSAAANYVRTLLDLIKNRSKRVGRI